MAANLALLAPSWGLFGGFLAALGWLGLALGDACCPQISKLRLFRPFLDNFRPLGSPFAVEKLRKRTESLRNHGENLPAATCPPRRNPSRVRRSREANSIRRPISDGCQVPNEYAVMPLTENFTSPPLFASLPKAAELHHPATTHNPLTTQIQPTYNPDTTHQETT